MLTPKGSMPPRLDKGGRQRIRVPFTLEMVRAQPNEGAALRLCMLCGGYEQEDLATELSVDFGTFSKVLSGKAQLPWAKTRRAMDLCGNEIPLIWRNESCGIDWTSARKHRSELEQQLADSEAESAKKDERIAILTELLQGRVPP